MSTKIKTLISSQLKTDLGDEDKSSSSPLANARVGDVRPGDTIQVHQKIKEIVKKTKKGDSEKKERIQIFEGLVIARKHGNEMGATITVRKVVSGIGVERIFPIHLPTIEKIEILKRGKVRRAKLYYMRTAKGKRARLKKKDFSAISKPIKPKIISSTSSDITKKLIQNKEKENNKQEVKKN